MKAITKNLFRSLSIVSGLIASLNFAHGQMLAQSASADSVVQVVADAEGLTLLSPEDVPLYGGTYWTIFPGLNGTPVPMPCLPMDSNVRVWAIADGQYLVDASGDVLPQATERMAARGVSSATLIQSQADAVDNLVLQVQANQQMQMMAMDVPTPGDGSGDGGTNSYTPDYSSFTVDFGTNLGVVEISLSSGNLNGTATNTQNGVMYDIQSRTNLTQTDWQYEGTILGSDVTNWTPLSVSQNGRPMLFLRLRSNGNDGSGLPSWWQEQYFGVSSGVNPNAQDPAGDGWSNWQKFQMGLNPNVFYTPPAPQGLTVNYNSGSATANISWQPSPGPVTGYTVTDSDGHVFNFSASTTSIQENVTNAPNGYYIGDPTIYKTYQVQAHYAGGNSDWSAPASLEFSQSFSAALIYSQNNVNLVVAGLPTGTVAIRLKKIDEMATGFFGDDSYNASWDIPVGSFTNGILSIPTAWVPVIDAYGFGDYAWWMQTLSANGDVSAAATVWNDANYWGVDTGSGASLFWPAPFFDGRAQLKQNLIFQLRAATVDSPFQFYGGTATPDTYVCAGFDAVDASSPYQNWSFDKYKPVADNYLYRNFVFAASELDPGGRTTTGVGGNYSIYPHALTLSGTPAYQFQVPTTFSTTLPTLLSTNDARWLVSYALDSPQFFDYPNPTVGGYLDKIGVTGLVDWEQNLITYTLASNARNYYGLPFQSVKIAWGDTSGAMVTVSAGSGTIQDDVRYYLYPETAQPQFQTAEYDFWIPELDWLPGQSGFSITNKSRVMITSIGPSAYVSGDGGSGYFNVAAYAKLAVTNAYSGVYGYLQQYFDKAYQIDTNGIVTTNTTGILSPYGDFFATMPGRAALVTMPDIDTGARGTGIVSCISVALNKSRSGGMDLSFNGPDATSASSPYVFWANNNFDRWDNDGIFNTPEQDDQQIAFSPAAPITPTSDCNYSNLLASGYSYSYRAIPCTRDLEDFARLWVCGITTNLLAALPSGSTVTLNWGDVGNPNPGNPTIDLFMAADADGGIGYLTNETVAATQTNIFQCPYIGRLGPGGSIQLNTIQFANGWAGNHFIWCGVSNGTGGLNLTITDGNGNVLAQSTAYIQIVDIKQMYERWTVGDDSSIPPTNTASLVTAGLPAGMSAFQYTLPTDPSTSYILHVHGYNMKPWEKDRFAETAFKRLYWQGYQGRFGAFNWPTAQNAVQFGSSEMQAWLSGQGLLNKLNDLNTEYPGHVYLMAHSLGNVVAGEALLLAGSNQVVNTYVAMQGAVAAHAYDPNTTPYTPANDCGTPDVYAHYWTNGAPCYFNATAGAGTYVNFFNPNDWALTNAWLLLFQNLKPILYPSYFYVPPGSYFKNYGLTQLYFPGDRYEIFNGIIQSRSYPIGMQADVGGAFLNVSGYHQVNLPSVWPPDPGGYTAHVWHSAEFRSDYPQRWLFWDEVLVQMGLKNSL